MPQDPQNPKDAIANRKVPLHVWPPSATVLGALGIYEGLLKYGRTNWRATPVKASVYISALLRHTYAYLEGEDADPATNGDHLGNALACLAILADARACGTLIDDRNFNGDFYPKMQAYLSEQTQNLQEIFKNANPRQYTLIDNIAQVEKPSRKLVRKPAKKK